MRILTAPRRRSFRPVFLLPALALIVAVPARADKPLTLAPAQPGHLVQILQPYVDNNALVGAVGLVATKDKILDLSAVGYADLATKTPMDVHDMFWIASMSKAMTVAAFMMLVDEGKVQLDDPVEKYLPEFKGQVVIDPKDPTQTPHPPSHPITVREILSHSSGLPFKSAMEKMPLDMNPLSVAVASYGKTPLVSDPGTQFLYANAGINTAGRIIEVLSGMPYETFLQKRLFDPLGMTDTTFWPNDEQVARLAKSYKANATKDGFTELNIEQLGYPLTDHTKRFPMPAGGLFSTATDVGTFCQMILNHGVGPDGKRLLSEEAIHQMTIKQTGPKIAQNYGFGLDVGGGRIAHGGAYKTYMGIEPKYGIVTVFLVQQAGKWPKPEGDKMLSSYLNAARKLGTPQPDAPAANGTPVGSP
jgi:CubicO group peptidase (beta-lactamase class C family)